MFASSMVMPPPFPLLRCFSSIRHYIVGPIDTLLLLDVDNTVLVCDDSMNLTGIVARVEALHAAMAAATYVLFITARNHCPRSWYALSTQLRHMGIEATEEHVLFTGAALRKGPMLYDFLRNRNMLNMRAFMVDDNVHALHSVKSMVPHVICLQFSGSFHECPESPLETAVVLPRLPAPTAFPPMLTYYFFDH